MPNWNTMTEPELSAKCPVADVLHPVGIYLDEAFGNDLNVPIDHSVVSPPRNGVRVLVRSDLQKPLGTDHGLDRGTASLAVTDRVGMVLHSFQQSQVLERFDYIFAGFETVLPGKWATVIINRGVGIHDIDQRQVVALPDFEVRRDMGGRCRRPRRRFQQRSAG